jgi:hypothetical protein
MTSRKELRERLYTPLNYEESLNYVNCWFETQKGPYNKQVVVISSINKDGSVFYIEKQLKTIQVVPSLTNNQGGETTPTKRIMVDTDAPDLPRKKGKLVYCNINSIINGSDVRPVGLMINTVLPLNLTTQDKVYTCINDGWEPGCKTNLGKYGTWNV